MTERIEAMSVVDRIAKLPPDKRAFLYRELRQRQDGGASGLAPLARPRSHRRRIAAGTGENFRSLVQRTGVLDSVTFRQAPRVAPGPGQVEVEAKALSLNFRDLMIALGMYPSLPEHPPTMGSDFSGRIVGVGPGVDRFKMGDAVLGLGGGHFAAYATVPAASVVPKPAVLTFEQATAIPTVFLTTYYALHRLARLSRGERVLIHSGAGGVGLAAIQIARWLGAEVFSTVGNDEKRAFLNRLGVTHVMNSRSLSWADDVIAITGGEGVDVILNSLAGDAIPRGLEILRPFGRFCEIGKRDIYANAMVGLFPFRKALSFFGVDLALAPAAIAEMLDEVMEHVVQGTFTPLPMRVFPIDQIVGAFSYMALGTHIGKIVLTLDGQSVLVES
jgi:NADPH:quinone reductase-like Zn-dependent oxidoreductase